MWEKPIPFGERIVGVNWRQDSDKMIFERAYGTFSQVGSMLFRWDALEQDTILLKSIYKSWEHSLSRIFNFVRCPWQKISLYVLSQVERMLGAFLLGIAEA